MIKLTILNSLQGKITVAYVMLVVSSIVLGIVAFSDLIFLEKQLIEGEVIADLKGNVWEMRKEEKNIFLYPKNVELESIKKYVRNSTQIIGKNSALINSLTKHVKKNEIQTSLDTYLNLFEEWKISTKNKKLDIRDQIRIKGHEISIVVKLLSSQERVLLHEALQKSQLILLVSVILIGMSIYLVGRQLRGVVVLPIKQLEYRLKSIADGRFKRLKPPTNDREFIAFTDAFNRMLRELEIRHKAMLQSEKLASLGILASGVAHELNNPLSNISTSCQLLIEEFHEADEKQLFTWLNQIDSETERGKSIVKTLLNFGSQKNFKKINVNLLKLVNNTQVILKKLISEHNATLNIEVENDLNILADQQRMQQLIINLIQNAILADENHINITISAKECQEYISHIESDSEIVGNLECLVEDDNKHVQICVEDNGVGMEKETLSKVFDPFFTTREPGHGFGLGLYIVKEIVNEHDGCLVVSSEKNKGTKVVIILPKKEGHHEG